ncbi:TonB-dependent receptor [Prolixibacter sp. SD074]|nr:TonB-dependent receptor [Prolixibacter sp. SD074]
MGRLSKKQVFLLALLIFVLTPFQYLFGQSDKDGGPGEIRGRILDMKLKQPIEYANIALFRSVDSVLINGTASARNGSFVLKNIPYGKYFMKIRFMGYSPRVMTNVELAQKRNPLVLGDLFLEPDVKQLGEVDVVEHTGGVSTKLDKTVVNVANRMEGAGGTVVDLLQRVPSVNVTPSGNLTLKGSENFLVLIDGKPTPLKGNNALKSIPSDNVQKVEVITNPSAKYDSDGTAGILNIITKKGRAEGWDGNITLAHDQIGGYASDFIINHKAGKLSFFVGADHNKRNMEGDATSVVKNYQNGYLLQSNQDGRRYSYRKNTGVRGGIEFAPSKKDDLLLSATAGTYYVLNHADFDMTYSSNEPDSYDIKRLSVGENRRPGDYRGASLSYTHAFNDNGHKLEITGQWNNTSFDNRMHNELKDEAGNLANWMKTKDSRNDDDSRINLDYSLPLGDKSKFEAGYQFRKEKESSDYTADLSQAGTELSAFSVGDSKSSLSREIHAFYSQYRKNWEKMELQLGLRAEHTSRLLNSVTDNWQKKVDKWDFFPSFFLNYHLPHKQTMNLAFSRRIDRLTTIQMEASPRWFDFDYVQSGNPFLDNEYNNSLSLTYSNSFKGNSITLKGYYDYYTNHIFKVQSIYAGTVVNYKFENVGDEDALGLDATFSFKMNSFWTMMPIFNFYKFRVKTEGELAPVYGTRGDAGVNIRWSNSFRISDNTFFQIMPTYGTGVKRPQGSNEHVFYTYISFRQQFLKKRLSLTVMAYDIFNTTDIVTKINEPDFYQITSMKPNYPIRLTISYRINNYKRDKRKQATKVNMD